MQLSMQLLQSRWQQHHSLRQIQQSLCCLVLAPCTYATQPVLELLLIHIEAVQRVYTLYRTRALSLSLRVAPIPGSAPTNFLPIVSSTNSQCFCEVIWGNNKGPWVLIMRVWVWGVSTCRNLGVYNCNMGSFTHNFSHCQMSGVSGQEYTTEV